jgi:Erg28 like protein
MPPMTSTIQRITPLRVADDSLYNITLWTFGLAWFHFTSEWMVYRTAGVGAGLLSPVVVASIAFLNT